MSESIITVDADGIKFWRNSDGHLHREDGPAIEHPDGTKMWAQNGICHRLDGPAVEWVGGSKEWWQNGQLHREDGPSVEYANGASVWHYNNKQLGYDLRGFWALWDLLDDEKRQNVNLHMWLRRLTNV